MEVQVVVWCGFKYQHFNFKTLLPGICPFKKSTHNILVVWKNPIAAPFTITKEIQSGWSFEYLKNIVRCFYFRLFCCTSNIGMVKNHFTWNIWHNWRWWFIQPCNVQITQQYIFTFPVISIALIHLVDNIMDRIQFLGLLF